MPGKMSINIYYEGSLSCYKLKDFKHFNIRNTLNLRHSNVESFILYTMSIHLPLFQNEILYIATFSFALKLVVL